MTHEVDHMSHMWIVQGASPASGGWMKEKVKIKVFDTQSFNLERE